MKEVIHYVSVATPKELQAEKMYYSDEELAKLLCRKKRHVAEYRVLMENDPVATRYVLEISGKVTRYDAFVEFLKHRKKYKGLEGSRSGIPDFEDEAIK